MKHLLAMLCAAAFTTAAAAAPPADVDGSRIYAADSEPGNWMSTGRTYDEQRYSPLAAINDGNVDKLGLAWTYRLDIDRGVEAVPLVIDGTMYTTSAYSVVYALDAGTGKLKWKFDPKVPLDKIRDACCGPGNRGVAAWKGRIYVGAFDGRLIALDAKSGKQVWSVDTIIDHKRSYTVTGAPRIVKGKVIIGNGGAELGVRGYINAYDADTGKLAWRIFTVPGDPKLPPENKMMEMALPTWSGEWYSTGGGGGGTAWDSMAYDPDLDLLYVGTGNGSMWNRQVRSAGKGDNLFLSSILALRPDTGEYVWHYQTTPGDTWDYTATQHMILANLHIGGKMRKVIMQAPKNAFFYVLDRATGELLSAEKYEVSNWASKVDLKTGRPVENPDADWTRKAALVIPGPLGAHNWQPMSFNPKTGLVYIPAQQNGAFISPDNAAKWMFKGLYNTGTQPFQMPETKPEIQAAAAGFKGQLVAWDPVVQKAAWIQDYPTMWNGGTLSTGGNLVFQGTADGRVVAYAADSGKKLWESPSNTGIIAAPVTYTVHGEQYVTFMAGWGNAFPLVLGAVAQEKAKTLPEARILTYKLGGKAVLPKPVIKPAPLPEPPPVAAPAEAIAMGRNLYNGVCGTCHGLAVVSGGVYPDLRYLTPEKHKIFAGIVAGAYSQRGMPSFSDVLPPEAVEAIHQYIIQRANDLKKELDAASANKS